MAGMPVRVRAASDARANRHTEQGATIITAAVDDSALTDTVERQLGLARASRPGTRTASAENGAVHSTPGLVDRARLQR